MCYMLFKKQKEGIRSALFVWHYIVCPDQRKHSVSFGIYRTSLSRPSMT